MSSNTIINRLFALGIMRQPDTEKNFPQFKSSIRFFTNFERILSEFYQDNYSKNIVFELKVENNKVGFRVNNIIYHLNVDQTKLNIQDIYDTFSKTKLNEVYEVKLDGNILTGKFKI